MTAFEKYLKSRAALAEEGISKYISTLKNSPAVLKDAMDYSLTAGGKRVRPVLLMAAAEAFGLSARDVLPAAAAVEMLHTYSLIHDDLPSMDNDSLRRGRPTNHKVFGEDTALLAGDAMLTFVFEVLSYNADNKKTGAANTLRAVRLLARYAGAQGMVGGQTADVFAEGLTNGTLPRIKKIKKDSKTLTKRSLKYFMLPENVKTVDAQTVLKYIHAGKTAALIKASVETGAALAGVKGQNLKNIETYATNIGLAFQVVDDILDVTVAESRLGKSGSDAQRGKLTYVSLYGIDYSRAYAARLIKNAKTALDKIKGSKGSLAPLYGMAEFFEKRTK